MWSFGMIITQSVFAVGSQVINATVRLSVCGDGVAEFPEECDTRDLKSQTCRSLGYDVGDLSCDIACDFDVTACYGVAPSPTPTATPNANLTLVPTISPTPSPTPLSLNENSNGSDSTNLTISDTTVAQSTFFPASLNQNISFDVLVKPAVLPFSVRGYDFDGSGIIEEREMSDSVTAWVTDWHLYIDNVTRSHFAERKKNTNCDLNVDDHCNIVDFSILLHYIGKKE
jgi:hypothetical protein